MEDEIENDNEASIEAESQHINDSGTEHIVDIYDYDIATAKWLEETRAQLTIGFIENNISEDIMVKTTLDWLALSIDFFRKYQTQAAYMMVFEQALESLKSFKTIGNAEEQFMFAKGVFLRRFKELKLTMKMLTTRGPFREGDKQRLSPVGKEAFAGRFSPS